LRRFRIITFVYRIRREKVKLIGGGWAWGWSIYRVHPIPRGIAQLSVLYRRQLRRLLRTLERRGALVVRNIIYLPILEEAHAARERLNDIRRGFEFRDPLSEFVLECIR